MEPAKLSIDEVSDMYTEILMNGFVPERVYFGEIGRWVDQNHPLTEEEFAVIFREKKRL